MSINPANTRSTARVSISICHAASAREGGVCAHTKNGCLKSTCTISPASSPQPPRGGRHLLKDDRAPSVKWIRARAQQGRVLAWRRVGRLTAAWWSGDTAQQAIKRSWANVPPDGTGSSSGSSALGRGVHCALVAAVWESSRKFQSAKCSEAGCRLSKWPDVHRHPSHPFFLGDDVSNSLRPPFPARGHGATPCDFTPVTDRDV